LLKAGVHGLLRLILIYGVFSHALPQGEGEKLGDIPNGKQQAVRRSRRLASLSYPMSLWLPCGLLGFAGPITVTVTIVTVAVTTV
jgi:hypothetical protein